MNTTILINYAVELVGHSELYYKVLDKTLLMHVSSCFNDNGFYRACSTFNNLLMLVPMSWYRYIVFVTIRK